MGLSLLVCAKSASYCPSKQAIVKVVYRVYDGFCQGCHLSPLLYITLVEVLDKEKLGVKVSEV